MASRTTERLGLDELRRSPALEVVVPGDPSYDSARATWNTVYEHKPVAVVLPTHASGVVDTVTFARKRGLKVGIQSTGHGPIARVENALLINMQRMNGVMLDLDRRRAVVQGGAKWQAVLDVIAPHGLAPLLGSTPDVSAVGYTLGGGLGWLSRKYGTSADSVHAFEVVTADGRLVRASADENQDLFWALRGAGAGHLGVVTSMEIQAYPIAEVYGGNLFYPAEMAIKVLRRWRDWLREVPESLTSGVLIMNYPDIEEIPEEFRGRSYVQVRGAFDGPMEEGEELLRYWRDWAEPEIDAFGPLPFSRIAEISEDPLEPWPNEGTGLWLHSLSDASIDAIVDALLPAEQSELMIVEMRHSGGALTRGSDVDSAYSNRDASILLAVVADLLDPTRMTAVRAAIANLRGELEPDLTGSVYLNFIDGPDRRHNVRDGIGDESYRRLTEIKAKWDPDSIFDFGLEAKQGV